MCKVPKQIYDRVTNRGGVQSAFIGLSKLQKMLNIYLAEMGISQANLDFGTATRMEPLIVILD